MYDSSGGGGCARGARIHLLAFAVPLAFLPSSSLSLCACIYDTGILSEMAQAIRAMGGG